MLPCKEINTKLLPMKIVMFGWFGASACVLPYMTSHMKELGMTVEETAIVYTLLPVTQFLSSPFAGFVADRLGKYRDVLLLSILMTVVLATAFLYVPPISTLEHSASIQIYCNAEKIVLRHCENVAFNKSLENKLHLESCYNDCNNSSFLNKFWNMTLEVKDKLNSSDCEYDAESDSDFNATLRCNIESPFISPNCSIMCQETGTVSKIYSDSISGRYLTFCLYLALRVLYNIFSAIGFTLVNSSAIALTEMAEAGEYGRQRFWAMLAMAIFSPLAGIMVDLIGTEAGVINYAPAFHIHNILQLLTAVAVWFLNFEIEDAPSSFMESFKNFWQLVRRPAIFFLLLMVFWLGTLWGFLESFLFLFMQDLGSPAYLLGLTVTIGSLVGLPFLHYARCMVSKVGHANLLSFAILMYMVRFIGCSFLINPWWIMPFEMLEIFTFHLMWVAAATYAAQLSPPGLLATIQGFVEGVHYGVGQGSGSLIGGSLIGSLGYRSAFRVIGGISGGVAVVCSFLHFVWLRKEVPETQTRRASIKFHSSGKDRKSSTLSSVEVNGTAVQHSSELQETTT